MAITSESSVAVDVKPISPEEIAALAEQTWSPLPDLNFEILRRWVEEGFQVAKVGWLTRYGPAYGGPGIYFVLKHPDGRGASTIVSPGKKVAEFLRKHAEDWLRKGTVFELVDAMVHKRQG